MGYFVRNLQSSGDMFSNVYAGLDAATFAKGMQQLMEKDGYKLSPDKPGALTYEKGNRVLRILFGAFVKYFKFNIIINTNEQGELVVNLLKQTSGISGGLIGMNQVKNEMTRLGNLLQSI